MNALTVFSTDLLTPLGAYLRLREGRRASFLLESVEKGRLGRHSFVGAGSRVVNFATVGAAIERVRPWAVDASSSLETAPGIKDHARVRAYVEAARCS